MLVEFAKAHKEKAKGKKDSKVYEGGYYGLGGIISGVIFVGIWDKFNVPLLDHKIKESVITHNELKNPNDITVDKTVALIISVGLMMSELFGVRGGLSSGSGFLLGYTAATQCRKGKYVGQT
jgi:hypothetical protein